MGRDTPASHKKTKQQRQGGQGLGTERIGTSRASRRVWTAPKRGPGAVRGRVVPRARGIRPFRPDSGAREPESQAPACPAARRDAPTGTPGAQRLANAPQACE